LTAEAGLTWRRALAGALPVALGALLLSVCLFADCQALRGSRVFGDILGEVTAVLNDAGTQWMVFACAGVYLLAFLVLRRRVAGEEGIGTRWNASLPDEVWLVGLLVLGAAAYALRYSEAVKSTQALTLLGGAMLGQGAAFWESWQRQKLKTEKLKTERGERKLENKKQKVESRNGGGTIVLTLIILLTIAAVWQGETGHMFQYRGQGRWSGPWDNPNTFGMLMGVGVVLALGRGRRGILGKAEKLKTEMLKGEGEAAKAESRNQKAETQGEYPTSSAERRTSNAEHRRSKWWVWAKRLFFLAAAGAMGVGLVRSYSRGAWVGTIIGMAYLLWRQDGRWKMEDGSRGRAEKLKTEMLKARRNWVAVAVIVTSIGVLGFWGFRDTEWRVARRAFSVGNVNDFSWRNRASAYEGSLQMMATKPWFGFGWNQGERVYEQFYRKPQVAEGAAIQLNDYFTLGTTLGVPALVCFAVYVGLVLMRKSPIANGQWQMGVVCQAGAVVLLVGFWFDGGLFKLATASTFWILLELGRVGNHEIHEAHEND
jgi:hypothetical protein